MRLDKFHKLEHTTTKGVKLCGAKRLLEHNCRTATKDKPDRQRANENINPELTCLNYDLAEPLRNGQTAQERHNDIIDKANEKSMKDLGRALRSDAVLLCDWILTVPKDLPPEKHKQFFEESFKFMCKQYGEENVISANVHMDETTPHMHFSFVPLVDDKKYGGKKLCAKNMETPKSLAKIHKDIKEYLEEQLDCPVNVINEATKDGNKSVLDMKIESARKDYEKLVAINAGESAKIVGKVKNVLDKISKGKKISKADEKHITEMVDNYDTILQFAEESRKIAEKTVSEVEETKNNLSEQEKELEERKQKVLSGQQYLLKEKQKMEESFIRTTDRLNKEFEEWREKRVEEIETETRQRMKEEIDKADSVVSGKRYEVQLLDESISSKRKKLSDTDDKIKEREQELQRLNAQRVTMTALQEMARANTEAYERQIQRYQERSKQYEYDND